MSHGKKQTIQEGFDKFVIKNETGCWGWKGCKPKNPGYGQFRANMERIRAHRASWILHFGEIPNGMWVLHRCDNAECSNPEHLYLGNQIDNMHDAIERKRHPYLGMKGELNHKARLKENQVKQIKQLVKSEPSVKKIAQIFNVSPSTIGNIKYNITWKELQ